MRDEEETEVVFFADIAEAPSPKPPKESKRKTLLYGETEAVTEAPVTEASAQAPEEDLEDALIQLVLEALSKATSPFWSQE